MSTYSMIVRSAFENVTDLFKKAEPVTTAAAAKPKKVKAGKASGMVSMLERIGRLYGQGYKFEFIQKTVAKEYGKDEKTVHNRIVVWCRQNGIVCE